MKLYFILIRINPQIFLMEKMMPSVGIALLTRNVSTKGSNHQDGEYHEGKLFKMIP